MDIFLQNLITLYQKAFINPLESFMMDGWMSFFWSFKNSLMPLESQDIISYNSDCVRLKEESHNHQG